VLESRGAVWGRGPDARGKALLGSARAALAGSSPDAAAEALAPGATLAAPSGPKQPMPRTPSESRGAFASFDSRCAAEASGRFPAKTCVSGIEHHECNHAPTPLYSCQRDGNRHLFEHGVFQTREYPVACVGPAHPGDFGRLLRLSGAALHVGINTARICARYPFWRLELRRSKWCHLRCSGRSRLCSREQLRRWDSCSAAAILGQCGRLRPGTEYRGLLRASLCLGSLGSLRPPQNIAIHRGRSTDDEFIECRGNGLGRCGRRFGELLSRLCLRQLKLCAGHCGRGTQPLHLLVHPRKLFGLQTDMPR